MLITKIMYLLKIEYLLNRGEDSSGGSDGESSLGFSAVKRKAPSVGQSNANNNNDTSKDAIGLLSFGQMHVDELQMVDCMQIIVDG